MKKQDVIKLFGGKDVDLARAIGRSKQCVSHWKEDLTTSQTEAVIAAAVRLNLPTDNLIPKKPICINDLISELDRFKRKLEEFNNQSNDNFQGA